MNPYRKIIAIEGSRGANATRVMISLVAETMDGSLDEPLADSCVSSSIRRMTFIVKASDLGAVVPQVGDIVRGEDNVRFAVRKVQPFYSREYILDCRSC